MQYQITNSSISIIYKGEAYDVDATHPNYKALRNALLDERWDEVAKNITVRSSLENWSSGQFSLQGEAVLFGQTPVPEKLGAKILAALREGSNPDPWLRFWEKLQENPSWRSVQQCFNFISEHEIPLSEEGYILAYKGVREDFKDVHSGTVDNTPGAEVSYPRNEVSDDPDVPCHVGLHVGSFAYANSFGKIVVLCRVHPRDVVCIPRDSGFAKMRCCAYSVEGLAGEEALPAQTVLSEEDFSETPLSEEEEPTKYTAGKVKATTFHTSLPLSGTSWDDMNQGDLSGYSLEELRRYATHNCKIVGASKIPGGRFEIIRQIQKVRGY